MEFASQIPTGGPPLSFVSGALNVPSNGPGPEYGRRIKKTDGNSAGSHLHLPNGEWTITHDYFVTPTPKLLYHLKIADGQMLWHNRSSRAFHQTTGRQTEMFLPHFCLNDVCRRGWLGAIKHLEPLVHLHRGTLSPNADVADAVERRESFLTFLSKPEVQWGRVFDPTSTIGQRQDGYQFLYWLAKEGILSRYTPVGSVLVQPQIQYGPTEQPRTTSRMQMTVAFNGVQIVTNIWGKRACQGAHLFEIVKRHKDPRTGYYGQYASIPYANMEKTIPPQELEYRGVAGYIEVGVAFYRGRVIDVLGSPAEGEELEVIQGLRGSPDESLNASNHASKLKIMQAAATRMS